MPRGTTAPKAARWRYNAAMVNVFDEPPLDRHLVGEWYPNQKLSGVCWLWDANGKLLEVLPTADVEITVRKLDEIPGGPRRYARYISFEEIPDQQVIAQRVQIAIERWKPMHQTPHLSTADLTA
jgi:hypothetical protein